MSVDLLTVVRPLARPRIRAALSGRSARFFRGMSRPAVSG